MDRKRSASETLDLRQRTYTNLIISAEVARHMCLGLFHYHKSSAILNSLSGHYGRKTPIVINQDLELPSEDSVRENMSYSMVDMPSFDSMFEPLNTSAGHGGGVVRGFRKMLGLKTDTDTPKRCATAEAAWERVLEFQTSKDTIRTRCEYNMSELRKNCTPQDLWIARSILQNGSDLSNSDWSKSNSLHLAHHNCIVGLKKRICSRWPYNESSMGKIQSVTSEFRLSITLMLVGVIDVHNSIRTLSDDDIGELCNWMQVSRRSEETARAVDTYTNVTEYF